MSDPSAKPMRMHRADDTIDSGELILPNADVLHDFGLYLPNHARIGPAEVQHVVDAFREVAEPKPFKP